MKTAIVYDRVNKWGGAERVLLTLHEMFPEAPLYTSVYNPKTAKWASAFPSIHTSFLQKIPFLKTRHELLAPLMPLAFESFNLDNYDLVISVTSEAAKGIIAKPGTTKHICYMLTPTRYLWSGRNEYFKGRIFKSVTKLFVYYLKHWDKIAAQKPDKIVAISSEVQKRVKKYYGRESEIVFPPVDIEKFQNPNNKLQVNSKIQITNYKQNINGEYYLVVSRLVGYKKVDLVIKAFNILGRKLIIVGVGREESKLRKLAGKNIEFTGQIPDQDLTRYYKNAKALIFPQVEDFGLVSVEAQAAGTPVIAYKSSGALDTVVNGETGLFFNQQTVDSLIQAVKQFDTIKFEKADCIRNSRKFSKQRFKKEFQLAINQVVNNKNI